MNEVIEKYVKMQQQSKYIDPNLTSIRLQCCKMITFDSFSNTVVGFCQWQSYLIAKIRANSSKTTFKCDCSSVSGCEASGSKSFPPMDT